MLDRREVPADLVVPAGFDFALHIRGTVEAFKHLKMSDRRN